MSTLKMVIHVEKTLKTTIKKNLTRSQKFARKIPVDEFRCSETIFLQFTVIITSNEQQVTSKRAKSSASSYQNLNYIRTYFD